MDRDRPFVILSQSTFVVWLALLGLVLLLRVPTLAIPFENDSGAIAYHARYINQGEPLYGSHHPSHHMPGAFYLYALAFQLFGDQVVAVKWVLLIWIWLTVCLLYSLGKKIGNHWLGLMAAIFAAVLYSHLELSGQSARIEMFLGLFHVTAILILVHTLQWQNQAPLRNLFLIGIVGGLAFLFKATALSSFGTACIACFMIRGQRPTRQDFFLLLQREGVLCLGFITSLLPALIYFAMQNLIPRLTLIFTLATQYVGVARPGLEGPQYLLLFPLAVLAKNNLLILIAALAGIIFVVRRPLKTRPTNTSQPGSYFIYIIIWFVLAFVETGTSRTYLSHYYLVFMPSLTLLAAWFLQKLYQDIAQYRNRKTAVSVLTLTLTAIFALSIQQNFSLYYHYMRYIVGVQNYETFLIEGLPDQAGVVALREQELANYLQNHTNPTDTIYYWSNFMELYYLANRRATIPFIWPIYAEASGQYEQIFQAKYIIMGNHTIFGLQETPQWLPQGLASQYTLETTIHEQAVYRRNH